MRPSIPLLLCLPLLLVGAAARHSEAQGQPPAPPTRLNQIRAADLERRADLRLAEGKLEEAGLLLEQAAGLRNYQEQRIRSVMLYLEAGAYARIESALRALPEGRLKGDGRLKTFLRVGRVLSGQETLDWNDYRSRIREMPRTGEAVPVGGDRPEAILACAHDLWKNGYATDAALLMARTVVQAHPEIPEARLLLSDLYRAQREDAKAEREMDAYVRLDPNGARARVAQVWRLRALGKKAEAAQILRKVLKQYPTSSAAFLELLNVYAGLDEPQREESGLKEALVDSFRNPTNGSVSQLQATIRYFAEAERWKPLEQVLTELTAARPGDSFLATALARCLLIEGRPADALRVTKSAPTEDYEARQTAFYAALAAGDLEEAKRVIPRTLDRSPLSLAAWVAPDQVNTSPQGLSQSSFTYRIPPFINQQPWFGTPTLTFEMRAQRAAEDLILERSPDVLQVQVMVALRRRDLRQWEAAGEAMRRAAAMRPDLWEPKLFLWDLALVQGDAPTWERFARELQDKLPKNVFPPPAPPGVTSSGYGDRVTQDYNRTPSLRALRAAQIQLLAGQIDPAITALQQINDPSLDLAVRRTLGEAYLAKGETDRAEEQWKKAGFYLPLRQDNGPGFTPGYVPPFLPPANPVLDGDGSRLGHYPLAFIAVEAARAFARNPYPPDGTDRLWEFLFRLSLQREPGNVPATYALGHLLKLGRYSTSDDGERREAEGQRLLETVLRAKPGDMNTLWALGRWEDAARANPESPIAWKRITEIRGLPTELTLEARRKLRRIAPDDVVNRYRLALLLSHEKPDEALHEARELAALPPSSTSDYPWGNGGIIPPGPDAPARAGQALVGALHWDAGAWSAAAASWQDLLRKAEGPRHRFGFGIAALTGLAQAAAGQDRDAEQSFRLAARVNTVDPLPRLFLGWLAAERGERDYQLAAASDRELRTQDGDGELSLRLAPALNAILQRRPDCFPARYLLARFAQFYNGESDYTPRREAARLTLEQLAREFPDWSGPWGALAQTSGSEERSHAFTTAAHDREARVLVAAAARAEPLPVRPTAAPGPVERTTPLGYDNPFDVGFYERDGMLLKLGGKLEVVDLRSGALVRSLNLERMGAPVLAERLVIAPVQGGFTAIDWKTGELVWTHEWKHVVSQGLALSQGRVVAAADDGFVVCLDAASGRSLWEASIGSRPAVRPLAIEDRAVLVLQSGENHGLSLTNGAEVWKTSLPAAAAFGAAPRIDEAVALDGRVILGGYRGGPISAALDAHDGRVLWMAEHGQFQSPRRFALRGKLLLVSDYSSGYLFLDPASGKEERAPVQVDRDGNLIGLIGDYALRRDSAGKKLMATDVVERAPAWEITVPTIVEKVAHVGGYWLTWSPMGLDWRPDDAAVGARK